MIPVSGRRSRLDSPLVYFDQILLKMKAVHYFQGLSRGQYDLELQQYSELQLIKTRPANLAKVALSIQYIESGTWVT